MSEACQPSLSYAGSAVNPSVPVGTMIVLTSAEPFSRVPVRAVTVTSEVMSEPELVMNCFAPLTTHWPSTSSARVLVAPASEPAPGSVRPKPASVWPATRSGSQACFCSSVPKVRIGLMPRPTAGLEGDAHGLVDAADLLDRHAQAGEVAVVAGAAELLGGGEPEQAQPAHLLHHVDGEVVVPVPLRGVRRDLALRELADAAAELLVLPGQLERP